ncbi:MAG: PfkB family carbohydrate kinase [Sphaerochaetaceae bacterium]
MKKIVCMGSVNMDLVMFAESIPIPGQTLVTDNFQTFPGGKGGNQAVAASKLGADVTYFTKLGTDSFSEELTAVMSSSGVNMDRNIQLKGGTAGIAMIMVDKNGQNSILFTPGANAQLTPQDVLSNKEVFEECDILLITLEFAYLSLYVLY